MCVVVCVRPWGTHVYTGSSENGPGRGWECVLTLPCVCNFRTTARLHQVQLQPAFPPAPRPRRGQHAPWLQTCGQHTVPHATGAAPSHRARAGGTLTQEHGVDGEVAALGILLPVSGELHLGVSPVSGYINTQGGDFKIFFMKLQ